MKLTRHLYDEEANRQMAEIGKERKAGEELNCVGVRCFKLTFIIVTAVTSFGTVVSLVLVFRTWKFYKSDVYRRFREQESYEAVTEMANNVTSSVGFGSSVEADVRDRKVAGDRDDDNTDDHETEIKTV